MLETGERAQRLSASLSAAGAANAILAEEVRSAEEEAKSVFEWVSAECQRVGDLRYGYQKAV